MQNFHDHATRGPASLHHLPHLEDLALQPGGARLAIDILTDLGNLLDGDATSQLSISTKWDGAPAVVFGPDPEDGRFFVSTKAALSATPKRAKTHAEIDALFSANVASILHTCLDELPALEPPSVMQGDFLFRNVDVYVTSDTMWRAVGLHFRPNVIKYSVPFDTSIGQRIRDAALGIVIHTVYADGTPQRMTPEVFGAMKTTRRVFLVDPTYVHDPVRTTFTTEESFDFNNAVEAAATADMEVDSTIYGLLTQDLYNRLVPMFINWCVREDVDPTARDFMMWLEDRGLEESKSRKSIDGKLQVIERFNALQNDVAGDVRKWRKLFRLHAALQTAKNLVIRKLAKRIPDANTIDASIDDSPTGPEGFVVRTPSGVAVKLVERHVFSRANLTHSRFRR